MNEQDRDTIWVVTESSITRKHAPSVLNVDDLSVNVNVFIEQMREVLEKTPEKLGRFRFVEFEVYAEVSAKGSLVLLGTGGEAGTTGGLKFVFKRALESE